MAHTIYNRYTGKPLYVTKNASDVREAVREALANSADLSSADLRSADLSSADLRYANLRYADLRYANLRSANLRSADLSSADLSSANLRSANLRSADLRSANLSSAIGLIAERVNDLLILLDQPGKIRAYKLTDAAGNGPFNGGLVYKQGKTYEVKKPNKDVTKQCGAGINLATLSWCLANWQQGYRIWIAEFTKADIAAIPIGDGKFRVSKAKIIKEIPPKQVYEWLSLDSEGNPIQPLNA